MGVEIERKFLVIGHPWRKHAESSSEYRQGYISTDPDRVVRIRLAGEQAFVTLKSRPVDGVRPEFEYPIPTDDARELLRTMCPPPHIHKTRHRIPHEGLTWEVDVFHGIHEGLVVAEVELVDLRQPVKLPSWAGKEVTGDPRYSNSCLTRDPDAWKQTGP